MTENKSLEIVDINNMNVRKIEKMRFDEYEMSQKLDTEGFFDEEAQDDAATYTAIDTPEVAAIRYDTAKTVAEAFYDSNKDAIHELALEDHLAYARNEIGRGYAEKDTSLIKESQHRLVAVQSALGIASLSGVELPKQ